MTDQKKNFKQLQIKHKKSHISRRQVRLSPQEFCQTSPMPGRRRANLVKEWSILGTSFCFNFLHGWNFRKVLDCALANVAQLVGASSNKPKGHRFDSRSGHIPRLRVQSLVWECTRENQSVFLSLSSPLSIINKHVFRWDLKRKRWGFISWFTSLFHWSMCLILC